MRLFADKRIAQMFGPADPSDVLWAISRDLPRVADAGDPDALRAFIDSSIAASPLSHNLRIAAIAAFRHAGMNSAGNDLLTRTMALYPESPIVLKFYLNAFDGRLLPAEADSVRSRLGVLFRKSGLRGGHYP
jgi:hypothetical protein